MVKVVFYLNHNTFGGGLTPAGTRLEVFWPFQNRNCWGDYQSRIVMLICIRHFSQQMQRCKWWFLFVTQWRFKQTVSEVHYSFLILARYPSSENPVDLFWRENIVIFFIAWLTISKTIFYWSQKVRFLTVAVFSYLACKRKFFLRRNLANLKY